MLAAAPMVILELGARPFQIPVVVEKLQPSGYLLRAAIKKGDDLMGAQKTMPVDEPDDVPVAFRESHGNDRRSALEAWKAGCHRATLPKMRETKKP